MIKIQLLSATLGQVTMKILFLVPYPLDEAPSQRFRFEEYFKNLEENGHRFKVNSFQWLPSWRDSFKSGGYFLKAFTLLIGFIRRAMVLFSVPFFDFIFIHREAAPIGPPVLEWTIAKLLRRKIIYDFDDAIWMTDNLHESSFERWLRWRSKVSQICKWSYKVSCGNAYLCTFAQQYNSNVVYNPTTINTDELHNPNTIKNKKKETITIGWTGSHSTLKYLEPLEPVLAALEKKYPQLEVLIIANQQPELQLRSLKFLPWRKESEIEDLLKMDIGIMPLPDDEWAKGKCGFKALQYMAMEIPAVVSSVGVNVDIIDHGVSGFHASTQEEWFTFLELLIDNESLRVKMGESGRKKVIDNYSVSSNATTFLSLFS